MEKTMFTRGLPEAKDVLASLDAIVDRRDKRIAELEAALRILFDRAEGSSISPYCNEMQQARKALGMPSLPENE